MKNLTILALSLGVALGSTSCKAEMVPYNSPEQEAQLVAVFTAALQNPKIRQQLQKQVITAREISGLEEMMMLKKMEMLEKLCAGAASNNKDSEKKDSKNKEKSFFHDVATGGCKVAQDVTKIALTQATGFGLLFVGGCLGLRYAPELLAKIVPAVFNFVGCGRTLTDVLLGYPCPA